jgi:hypothetical protein
MGVDTTDHTRRAERRCAVKVQWMQSPLRRPQQSHRPNHYWRTIRRPTFLCMPQSPNIAGTAPDEPFLTDYDERHLVTYLRLLDADAEGADWREVAKVVLGTEAHLL